MKNIKFSRLFAAMMVVACLALAGCSQPEDETTKGKVTPLTAEDGIVGTWVCDAGDKYSITVDKAAETGWDMWAFNIEEFLKVSDSAGVLYGILTKGSDWTPAGEYYALAYKDLTENTATIAAAGTSYSSLEEVKAKCTIDNMFTYFSECTKE